MLNYSPNPSYAVIGGSAEANEVFGEVFDLKLMQSNNTWWSTSYRGLTYGGTDIHTSKMNVAILDTGTSLIALPDSDYNLLVSKVMAEDGSWDCVTNAQCQIAASCATVSTHMASSALEI